MGGGQNGMKQRKDVQQGTLALMVLKTLDVLGPLHGYGIARRIEQISGDRRPTQPQETPGWTLRGPTNRTTLPATVKFHPKN